MSIFKNRDFKNSVFAAQVFCLLCLFAFIALWRYGVIIEGRRELARLASEREVNSKSVIVANWQNRQIGALKPVAESLLAQDGDLFDKMKESFILSNSWQLLFITDIDGLITAAVGLSQGEDGEPLLTELPDMPGSEAAAQLPAGVTFISLSLPEPAQGMLYAVLEDGELAALLQESNTLDALAIMDQNGRVLAAASPQPLNEAMFGQKAGAVSADGVFTEYTSGGVNYAVYKKNISGGAFSWSVAAQTILPAPAAPVWAKSLCGGLFLLSLFLTAVLRKKQKNMLKNSASMDAAQRLKTRAFSIVRSDRKDN